MIIRQAGRQAGRQQTDASSVKSGEISSLVAANSAKIRRQRYVHGDEFSHSSRLRATRFARVYGKGFRENRKSFARNCREKFLRDYEKSARFSASEINNRANFARSGGKSPCEKHKVFARASGFTIIEVALVLAIAGLIFLVVFLALPALQCSQRDTARCQDVAKAVAAVQQYYADGGDATTIPRTVATSGTPIDAAALGPNGDIGANPVLGSYLKNAGLSTGIAHVKIFAYPAGNPDAISTLGVLEIFVGEKCGGSSGTRKALLTRGTASDMAVALRLESGSAGAVGGDNANVLCQTASR